MSFVHVAQQPCMKSNCKVTNVWTSEALGFLALTEKGEMPVQKVLDQGGGEGRETLRFF